jgi:hypothetical protein
MEVEECCIIEEILANHTPNYSFLNYFS